MSLHSNHHHKQKTSFAVQQQFDEILHYSTLKNDAALSQAHQPKSGVDVYIIYGISVVIFLALQYAAVAWLVSLLVQDYGRNGPYWGMLAVVVSVVIILLASIYSIYQGRKKTHIFCSHALNIQQINEQSEVAEDFCAMQTNQKIAQKHQVTALPLYVIADVQQINAFAIGEHIAQSRIYLTWGAVAQLNHREMSALLDYCYRQMLAGDTAERTHLKHLFTAFTLVYQHGLAAMRAVKSQLQQQHYGRAFLWQLWAGWCLAWGYVPYVSQRLMKKIMFYSRQYQWDHILASDDLRALMQRTKLYLHAPRYDECLAIEIDHLSVFDPCAGTIFPHFQQRVQRIHQQQQFKNDELAMPEQHLPLPQLKMSCPVQWNNRDEIRPLDPNLRQRMLEKSFTHKVLATQAHYLDAISLAFLLRQDERELESYNLSASVQSIVTTLDPRLWVEMVKYVATQLHLPRCLALEYSQKWQQMIEQRGDINILDALLLELLKDKLGILPHATPQRIEQIMPSVVRLLDSMTFVQCLQTPSSEFRTLVLQQTLGDAWLKYQQISYEAIDFADIFQKIAGLAKRDRLMLLTILEFSLWQENGLTQEGMDVLVLLYWRLGFDTAQIEQRLYRRNQVMIF
ncbi:MAG: M48 family metalloprotease [Acinetobacter sp.]|nr:M48 family metalloprotease [Acinetobacter sp.]